jgi:EAL domain-containing protein (putative c-di-GMP-specific phosphodiesterase class I)
MQVVAEGVDSPESLAILAESGCDLVQGFLILPPVPAQELLAWSHRPQVWSRTLSAGRASAEGREASIS